MKFSPYLACSAALLCGLLFSNLLAAAETGWKGDQFPAPPSSVKPEAIVAEGGTEIKWAPEAFQFTPGGSVRYVDFEGGDDNEAGDAKDAAWKHHPWDPQAGGKAAAEKGVHSLSYRNRQSLFAASKVG